MARPTCFILSLILLAGCGQADEGQPQSSAGVGEMAGAVKPATSGPQAARGNPDQYVVDLRALCPGGGWTVPAEFNEGRIGRIKEGRFHMRYGCRPNAGRGAEAAIVNDRILVAPIRLEVEPTYGSEVRAIEQFDKEGVIERSSDVDESYYERNGDDGNFPARTGLREKVTKAGQPCLDVKMTSLTWSPFGEDEREARAPWYSRVKTHMDDSCKIVVLYFDQRLVLINAQKSSRQRVADLLIENIK